MSIITKRKKAFLRRLGRSLAEVSLMESGKVKGKTFEELLDSLPDGKKKSLYRELATAIALYGIAIGAFFV